MKKIIHTDKVFKERRRLLRNEATPQEVILWSYLKGKNLGYKFQRQHSIGGYIVDFYCAKKDLIIELDGSQHNSLEAKEYDKVRTAYFKVFDYKILRFWNNEIDTNIEGVLFKIKSCLKS